MVLVKWRQKEENTDHELSESEMIYNSVLSNPKTSLLSVGRAKSRQQFFKVHPDKINIKL